MSATLPEWLRLALLEVGDRISETPGPGANPRIVGYDSYTSLRATSDEVPWCSAFVAAMLETAGIRSTQDARARSYLKWGYPLEQPVPGAVTILDRPPNPEQGHVGFWVGERLGNVYLCGGNQGDAVSIAKFPIERVIGYRWPEPLVT